MKTQLLLFSVFFIAGLLSNVFPQKHGASVMVKSNMLFAEWYGNGIFYSFNYEKMYRQNVRQQQCIKIGAMIYPSVFGRRGWLFAFPVEMNVLLGERRNKIELGIGNTFTTGRFSHMVNHRKKGYVTDYYTKFLLIGRIGYRIYNQGGIVFRFGLLPLLVYKPGYTREAEDSPLFEAGSFKKNTAMFNFSASVGLGFGYSF